MKLCRFRVGNDTAVRAGVFHEGKVYETDGEKALGVFEPGDVQLLAPIAHAPSLRRFNAFTSRNGRPKFEFGNPAALTGPETEIRFPQDASKLDFEIHIAAVIGTSESDLEPREADDYILGFTILNGWAVRDADRHGTPKAWDFAATIGPFLVTPEELDDKVADKTNGKRYNLNMKALVNGEVVASSNLSQMEYTFAELLSEASRGAKLNEGDVISSGCAQGGSLLQVENEFLQSGDEVTILVERLGSLMNRVRVGLPDF